MNEEVKFIRGNDRINQLTQRPDIAEGVSRIRAEMDEADRTYAMGLAASPRNQSTRSSTPPAGPPARPGPAPRAGPSPLAR
ncbi:MAG: hypothetical protein J2P25_03480 [Nocardiopsaceae bacterium]|nr:hypothetical protein [Nocardiopsaceae bacterium]